MHRPYFVDFFFSSFIPRLTVRRSVVPAHDPYSYSYSFGSFALICFGIFSVGRRIKAKRQMLLLLHHVGRLRGQASIVQKRGRCSAQCSTSHRVVSTAHHPLLCPLSISTRPTAAMTTILKIKATSSSPSPMHQPNTYEGETSADTLLKSCAKGLLKIEVVGMRLRHVTSESPFCL